MRSVIIAILVGCLGGCASSGKSHGPEGDAQAQEAEQLLVDAERLTRSLEVEAAQKRLDGVRVLLKDPRLQAHPDQAVLWDRFNTDQGDLEIARKDRVKRDISIKANAQLQTLERARGPLLKALEDLEKPDVTAAQLDVVRAAIKKVQETLPLGKALEAQDPSYAEEAKHAQRLIEKSGAAIALAEKRLAFMGGPLAAAEAGLKLSAQAKAEKDKAKRQPLANDAKTQLEACLDGTQKALEETPDLGATAVLLEGKPKTVATVSGVCKSSLKSTDKLLAMLAKAPKKRGKK